jgi:hypothetical protein
MTAVRRGVTARTAATAAGRGARLRAIAISLLVLAALAWTTASVMAADPTASPGGDVRTNPSAPGLAGDPLFALAGVVVIGLVSVAVTLVAVRLADRR